MIQTTFLNTEIQPKRILIRIQLLHNCVELYLFPFRYSKKIGHLENVSKIGQCNTIFVFAVQGISFCIFKNFNNPI